MSGKRKEIDDGNQFIERAEIGGRVIVHSSEPIWICSNMEPGGTS
jgi:hypothetical protein